MKFLTTKKVDYPIYTWYVCKFDILFLGCCNRIYSYEVVFEMDKITISHIPPFTKSFPSYEMNELTNNISKLNWRQIFLVNISTYILYPLCKHNVNDVTVLFICIIDCWYNIWINKIYTVSSFIIRHAIINLIVL